MEPTLEHRIRERAYEIWHAQGQTDGKAHEHWLAAEREVLSSLRAPSPASVREASPSPKAASPAHEASAPSKPAKPAPAASRAAKRRPAGAGKARS
jgi:hypothetical protein